MSSKRFHPLLASIFDACHLFFSHNVSRLGNVRTELRQGDMVFNKNMFNENMVTTKTARPLLSTQVTYSTLEIKLDRDSMAYTLHLSGGNRSCWID